MIFRVFLSGLLLFIFSGSKSQDTLLLLTGKVLTGEVLAERENYTLLSIGTRNDSLLLEVENERIFSIKKSGQPERVIYTPNEAIGNVFTVEELRYFIHGEQDADQYYKPTKTFLFGIATGAACGWYIDQAFPWVLAGPFVYTGIQLLPLITIRQQYVTYPEMLKQETYVMGFERVARGKKIQAALKGSIIGLVTGAAASYLIKQN